MAALTFGVGLAVLLTIALHRASGLVRHGAARSAATTDEYVLAFRVAAGVLAAGAVLVLAVLENDTTDPTESA